MQSAACFPQRWNIWTQLTTGFILCSSKQNKNKTSLSDKGTSLYGSLGCISSNQVTYLYAALWDKFGFFINLSAWYFCHFLNLILIFTFNFRSYVLININYLILWKASIVAGEVKYLVYKTTNYLYDCLELVFSV